MLECHALKKGQVLVCGDCGLELQVIQECEECGSDTDNCTLCECKFECCGEELRIKE